MCNSLSSLVIFTAIRKRTYLSVQECTWLNIHGGTVSFFTNSVLSVLKGAGGWHENIAIPSGLTFKSQHCCYETAWVIEEDLAGFGDDMNGYFWIGFFETTVPNRELATVIFIRVHIIHVGALWSAAELSVHKTALERSLDESDKAACTKTAQMTWWREKTRARERDDLCVRWF